MAQIDNTDTTPARRALSIALRGIYAAAVLAATVFAFAAGAVLFTTYYDYGRFPGGGGGLSVFASETFGETYGLVDIYDGRNEINLILEAGEWDTLLSLWRKAKQMQGGAWRTVGAISETDANNARLFLLSGPGLRMVLREGGDCVAFDLPAAQMPRFEQSLLRVKDHFAGKVTGVLIAPDRSNALSVAADALSHWPPLPPDLPHCGR